MSINAEENRLTGVCLICDSFAIVIVEGVKKARAAGLCSDLFSPCGDCDVVPALCVHVIFTDAVKFPLMHTSGHHALQQAHDEANRLVAEGAEDCAGGCAWRALLCGTNVLRLDTTSITALADVDESEILLCASLRSRARAGREQPEESDDDDDGTPNKCTLVWQGGVLQPAFRKWQRFETVRTEAAAAKYLEDLGLRHYWCGNTAGCACVVAAVCAAVDEKC